MRKPRLFIFDPNLKSSHGHYLGYATRIASAAEEFGVETVIVGNIGADVEDPEFQVVPALELDYWHEMRATGGENPHEHLARSADIFASAITAQMKIHDVGSGDVAFFPYANLAEAMGLGRVSRELGESLPRTVLLFRRDLAEQGEDAGIGPKLGAGLLRQALADLYVAPGAQRVRLLTDSENLTEEYIEGTRRHFQTAPIPVDPRFAARFAPRASRAITLLYLGDARTEKGYLRIPAMAEEIAADLADGRVRMVVQSNFNVPDGEPGIAEARERLSRYPNVVLLTDSITDEEYLRWMHEADLVLLPYQAERYVARTSGILAEAIHAGVPSLVPQGTWLSEQILRHGAGIAFGSHDPQSVRRAVRTALDDIGRLKERALSRREAFTRFHNPARLARFVCGAEVVRRGEEFVVSRPSLRYRLRAEREVAFGSPDHQHPHGTRLDNSRNTRFNRKLYHLLPNRTLRVLDIGCSGGGFVKSCLDDGHVAVGLEGSDFSKRHGRAEWKRIPDHLFTCDATGAFEIVHEDSTPARFDVVTSWEFIEHISEADLPAVCRNVARHLDAGGIWILSVSPNEEVIDGVRLHQTVEGRDWWIEFFRSQGFEHHPELADYFGDDWVRGPHQNAPGSFHLILTYGESVAPRVPRRVRVGG